MSPYFFATLQQPLLPMDLVLRDLKVLVTEVFFKDIKKM